MANLPEKNVVLVDKITNVPTDSNLFINANGEFKQASVNDVVNSSTVVSTAVETAINTAVQDSIDSNFKQTSGSPILLTDSADGTLIDFKGKGRSTQKQYSGKNMLAPTLATATSNGITCTNNGNGTYTLNGTSTDATYFNLAANYQLNAGTYKFVGVPSAINGLKIYQGGIPNAPVDSGNGVTFSLDSDISNYKPFIEVLSGKTLNNVIIKPMLTTDLEATYDTYEPYVGGTASPNPDYPQEIESVADGGWFDGELLSGMYKGADGTYINNANYVCSKNMIPCAENDVIKLIYGKSVIQLVLLFYDENKNYIDFATLGSVKELSATAPINAKYFHFDIHDSNLTLQTAKHITVTINGKYTLIVKSKGKNLLNINEIDKDTKFFSYTKYTNDIVKATATKTSVGEFICSFSAYLEKGKTYTFSYESINGMPQVYIYYDKLWGNRVSFLNISYTPNYTHNVDSGIYIIGYFGNITSGTEYSVVKPMLRRAEVTDDTYEPYKETVTYIPLNEPLRSSLDGSVSDVASLNEINRKFAEVVLNGSENWAYYGSNIPNAFYTTIPSNMKPYCKFMCAHYAPYDNLHIIEDYGMLIGNLINIKNKNFSTVDEWKAYLQAKPITVIYELAEPIIEKIEPVDIVTYDNVTYLTASDNAEMELEYPTSKVAGIASIGYSKGRKAEYEVELLKAQLLELQTAMVNSL